MTKFTLTPLTKPLLKRLADHFSKDHETTTKVEALGVVYDMLDAVMVDLSRQATCKSGCVWCCNIACDILPLEAEYIAAHTDHKINIGPMPTIDYCQFLVDSKCSIYEHRPFNCRAFLSFESPDYCRDKKPHLTTGGPTNGYGSKAVLMLGYQMVMIDTGMEITPKIKSVIKKRIKDIREFFR